MTDTIFLIINQNKVDRMVKTESSATNLYKGEIPVKLIIEVPDDEWKRPFLEKKVLVNRWDKGIDIEDVQFKTDFVTEDEAEMIRQARLQKMKEVLESQGYKVEREEL